MLALVLISLLFTSAAFAEESCTCEREQTERKGHDDDSTVALVAGAGVVVVGGLVTYYLMGDNDFIEFQHTLEKRVETHRSEVLFKIFEW